MGYFAIILIFLIIVFFAASLKFRPDINQFRALLNSVAQNDVIIIYNSGGWGYTPFEKSEDFGPMVEGIKNALSGLGYNPTIIPYIRCKKGFLGKIIVIKEALNAFNAHIVFLNEVEDFLNKNPEKKIIMAGLSFGGYFIDQMMRKLPENLKNRVLAIEFGSPFWNDPAPENILRFNNHEKDPIARGKLKGVAKGFFKIYFKWMLSVILGRKIALSEMLHLKGHDYSWHELKPEIVSFLEKKLK